LPSYPRILITPGEPAGIGPDITIKMAQKAWDAKLVVVGDPDLLTSRAKLLNLPLTLKEWNDRTAAHQPGELSILPIALNQPVVPGILNTANAEYVINSLTLATDYCLQKKAEAWVTGPVNKSILNQAGYAFTGHTEFLAERCQTKSVIMLFVAPQMKVALITTHLPLSQVADAISQEKISTIITLLHRELIKRFNITNPRILVCGLNPHAGEQGHLGREEIEIIQPALQELRAQHIDVIGPLPADTLFTEKYLIQADAIVAMYHDQALPVVKYLGFGNAVNVTLGLPIIRTSVDHGTALDVAGTQQADPGSLEAALRLALQLSF